jgi:hypothetical protein
MNSNSEQQDPMSVGHNSSIKDDEYKTDS